MMGTEPKPFFWPNSLPTTLCVTSEWVEFTDGCIFEWTFGGGGQVITTWSQSRSATRRNEHISFTDYLVVGWLSIKFYCEFEACRKVSR